MKVAVLSGKGGAGKTLIAVNLAAAAKDAVYIDCDVEEPNGRLFFNPDALHQTDVCTALPEFDTSVCTGCRACTDFCRFNALVFIKGTPRLFPEVCHSCGGCMLVCPTGAVRETASPIGHLETGVHQSVTVVTGVLNPGEASGVPVIRAALKAGAAAAEEHCADKSSDTLTVIDCPPGSACPVMESISGADYCLLVAEPTAFGFHNFRMVYELAVLLHKPCGVVINKMDAPYEPLEAFCREHGLPVLLRLPFSQKLAQLAAQGTLLTEHDNEAFDIFSGLSAAIRQEAAADSENGGATQ